MATQDKLDYRYAKAVFDYLKDQPQAGEVLDELRRFASIATRSSDLTFLIATPAFTAEERRAVVMDIATKLKVKDLTCRILVVLSDLKRLGHIDNLVDRMTQLFLEARNVVLLKVRTADELDEDAKEKIRYKFGKVLGKEVEARYEIDPTLIGGLRVVAGGRTYDGSVDGWLTSFEERLVGGNI